MFRLIILSLSLALGACSGPRDVVPTRGPVVSSEAPPAPPLEISSDLPSDVSPLLETIRDRHAVVGMAACTVTRDGVREIGAAGKRSRGAEAPITTGDLFHLGSCTKAMTATLCAILVEEEVLDWSGTLGEYFSDLEVGMHEGYRSVTLEQLVTNHGGFPTDLSAGGLWGTLWAHDGSAVEARRTLLEGVVVRAPAATVGSQYLYSNAGFSVAGHIAEVVTGIPYEELIREKLFTPLGIESAGFGAPGTRESIDQPRGHGEDGTPIQPGRQADNPVAIAPAGRAHMTISDWAKYVRLHLRGVEGDAGLLTRESFRRLHEPYGSDYAYGWGVTKRDWGGTVMVHSGSNTRWFCVAWVAPERGFAVLVTCNQGGAAAARACDEAAAALIRRQVGR